jgi:hypothetical protein
MMKQMTLNNSADTWIINSHMVRSSASYLKKFILREAMDLWHVKYGTLRSRQTLPQSDMPFLRQVVILFWFKACRL